MSECLTCGEFTVACSHYKGTLLAYVTDKERLPLEVRHQWIRPADKRFYVFPLREEFNDYNTALAAFHEAEERLLRGTS